MLYLKAGSDPAFLLSVWTKRTTAALLLKNIETQTKL